MPAGAHSLAPPALTVVLLARGRSAEELELTWRSLATQEMAPADVWLSTGSPTDKSPVPRAGQCPGGKFRVFGGENDADLLKRTEGGCLLWVTAGDQLLPNAIRRFGEFLAVYRDALLVYADDVDANGRLKPKRVWTPHAMFSCQTPWHGLVFRREFIAQQWKSLAPDGVLEPAAALLCAVRSLPSPAVLHIPEPLMKLGASTIEAPEYRKRVMEEWHQQGLHVDASGHPYPPHMPAVGIVLADRGTDGELIGAATGLLQGAHGADLELVIATRADREPRLNRLLAPADPRIRVTGIPTTSDPPSLAALYNAGAAHLQHPVLVFLHPEVAPAEENWLKELVTALHFAAASAAVPRLLDAHKKPMPTGRFLGDRVAGVSPPAATMEPWDNVGAAHGIALAVRRSEFEAVGGFYTRYADAFFDLSFSLRLRARGGAIVLAQRSRVIVPEHLLDPVLRNEDAEVFVRDEQVALAPADRLLCNTPGLWESCSRARSTALDPEHALCPDDATAVAGWALEHSVTLSAPAATLEQVAEDLGYAAAYILQARLEHPEWRNSYPHALTDGAAGAFCAMLCQRAEEAGMSALADELKRTFARDPGARIRELFQRDAALRFFHPLGLLPEGCWRLAAWLLGEGHARHQITNEEAWWFLITTHEQPEHWLRVTLALRENDERKASPASHGLNLVGPTREKPAAQQHLDALASLAGRLGEPWVRLDDQALTPPEPNQTAGPAERHDITVISSPDAITNIYTNAHLCLHRDRYRIGCWNWPFARLPKDWAARFRGLDELWVPSYFAEAVARQQSAIPVHRILLPCAVEPAIPDRQGLGLPESTFIVLASCTDADDLERKNIATVIRAFLQAFRRDDRVLLVVKTCGAAAWDKRVQHCKSLAGDAGVCWVDTNEPAPRFQQWLASCDAYVSLHRCAPQGRVLAEAMQQGRPCVATNYGGPLDFMNELNSRLVSHQLRPAETQQVAQASGVEWAVPDLQEAAHCLRWIYEQRDAARAMGERGQAEARAHFDEKQTARAIRSRLAAIRHERA